MSDYWLCPFRRSVGSQCKNVDEIGGFFDGDG